MTGNNATGETDFLTTSVSRLYAFGGVFLILSGMLLGDIFAAFILHPNNARIGEAIYAAAMAIPSGDADAILGHFQSVGGFLEHRGTKVAAHTHAIVVGYVAVLLAILQPVIAMSGNTRLLIARVYVFCAIALPIAIFTIHYAGLAYSPFEYIGWASVAADLAGIIIAALVLWQLLGLWRYSRSGGMGLPHFLNSISGPGRILLLGGVLLVLAGFLFGAGYAAWLKYMLPSSEVDILKSIIANAAAGNSVDADFAAYGGYLAFRGLTMAAHAHVNTMGILLLIMALVQPFVLLSDTWKRRWAIALVIGAWGLPIFILLEFKLGLLAGGFADTAGLLAMLAIGAMLVGMTRLTAIIDHEGTR